MKLIVRNVVMAVCLPLLATGCSLFRSHNNWEKAAASRPLEIPPDLDAPASGNAMVVPPLGTNVAPPPSHRAGGGAPSQLGVDGLHVADGVASTWQRVGLALERAQLGTVDARDENAHTYAVTLNYTRTAGKQGGWFKRMFSSTPKPESVTGQVNIGVSADGSGSRVSASGDRDAVAKVLELLRDRLG